MDLSLVILLLAIVLPATVYFFLSIPYKKPLQRAVDKEIDNIVNENSILRNQATLLERKVQIIHKINRLISEVAPIFYLENVLNNISKIDLSEFGITHIGLILIEDGKAIASSFSGNITEDRLKGIIDILLDEFILSRLGKNSPVTSDILYIQNRDLLEKIKKVSQIEDFFVISPLRFENRNIGLLLLGTNTINPGSPELFSEVAGILAMHLAYIISNTRLYEKNRSYQQELEHTVQLRTQELQDAIEKISQHSKAKTEFVSTVAHELRTSLTAIKGFASLIYEGKLGEIDEKARDRVYRIIIQVNRLVEMVNTLLDINKIESGSIEMQPIEINARNLINSVIDSFLAQITEKEIKVEVHCREETRLYADYLYIERALYNLLSNAIKFTPQGGEIFIRAMETPQSTIIEVEDTGVGIPDSDIDNIFHEFYHLDHPETTNIRGIGLGLALVKRVVLAHKGKISVKSYLGKGTTFIVEIPKTGGIDAQGTGL